MSAMDEPLDEEQEAIMKQWQCLALIHGFNELARQSKRFGDRVGCRLIRDKCIDDYRAAGHTFTLTEDSPPVLTLRDVPPLIVLREKDIEAMREAVRLYDERQEKR